MSQYAQDMPHILAALNGIEDNDTHAIIPPDEEQEQVVHVYPVEGGGLLLSKTPIEEEEEPSVIDSRPPTTRKAPPSFLSFLLLLALFVLLDTLNSTLMALLTPTAIITIVPKTQTITLQSTAKLGKLLSPLTLSESQTVPATGHGHQDARAAIGTVTFYNGLAIAQTIAAGTVLTVADGIQVATDHTVTIPAGTPPTYGEATDTAHALLTGSAGNIQAGDISTPIAVAVFARNLLPFSGGQDARDFQIVTKADKDIAAATLTGKVTASMNAALQEQLSPTEQAARIPCHPAITANRNVGDEATQVQVTVSETCRIIAYNSQELTAQATLALATQARTLGAGYSFYGSVAVRITKVTTLKPTSVMLSYTCMGIWVYHINQQQLLTLIAGKPRQAALHLLSTMPGIQRVTITGIADNTPLPLDPHYLKFLELVGV